MHPSTLIVPLLSFLQLAKPRALQTRSDVLSTIFSCPSASWPPAPGIGSYIEAQPVDMELQDIMCEIDPQRIQAIVEKLASYGTRHTLSLQNSTTRGIGASRDWLVSEFQKIAATSNGQMTISTPSYIQGITSTILFPVNITNVVATLKGSETPERYYVVSGHYDSRCTDIRNYESDAPGADDE